MLRRSLEQVKQEITGTDRLIEREVRYSKWYWREYQSYNSVVGQPEQWKGISCLRGQAKKNQ